MEKKCRRCNELKPVEEFRRTYIKSAGKYYLRSYCKKCLNKINNERRANNPELRLRKNERDRKYYHKHKCLPYKYKE